LGWVYAYRVPYSDASPKKWDGERISGRDEMKFGWVPYMHHRADTE